MIRSPRKKTVVVFAIKYGQEIKLVVGLLSRKRLQPWLIRVSSIPGITYPLALYTEHASQETGFPVIARQETEPKQEQLYLPIEKILLDRK